MGTMKRRDALKAIGLSVVAGGLFFHRCSSEKSGRVVTRLNLDLEDGREVWERERLEELNAQTFFEAQELAVITVLVDMILPKDEDSPSASEVGVVEFIEFIVKDRPELQKPMREGLKWMDTYSSTLYKHVFVELDDKQKIDFVDRIAYPEDSDKELTEGVAFFSLIRELAASGYFTSKEGIAYLGYVGNRPNVWAGVPKEVLEQYKLSQVII